MRCELRSQLSVQCNRRFLVKGRQVCFMPGPLLLHFFQPISRRMGCIVRFICQKCLKVPFPTQLLLQDPDSWRQCPPQLDDAIPWEATKVIYRYITTSACPGMERPTFTRGLVLTSDIYASEI